MLIIVSRPAVLSQDFGNLRSKCVLAFWNQDNQVQIARMGFQGRIDNPDYPDGTSDYEFVAYAAIKEDSTMIKGIAAQQYDIAFPLKTLPVSIAIKNAQHRKQGLTQLPFGLELLEVTRAGGITSAIIKHILATHSKRLRRIALVQAEISSLQIKALAITSPGYLFKHEKLRDLDRYIYYYLHKLLQL